MDLKLSLPWIVFSISNTEFCISTNYVKSISKLESDTTEIGQGLVRGIYNVSGVGIPVIDGRKLAGIKTIAEERLIFSESVHKIKYEHLAWMNELEWCISTGDAFTKPLDCCECILTKYIEETLKNPDINLKLKRILKDTSKQHGIIHNMAAKALMNCSENLTQSLLIFQEIKRESDKYLIKNLDKLVEINNAITSEECLVIRCKDKTFGLAVDNVKFVADYDGEIDKICENRLCAGRVRIKGTKYNSINVTKLYHLIK